MKDIETKILAIYLSLIKTVGGRGPRNAHIKCNNSNFEIHFWLNKSPFEEYIYTQLENGNEILSEIYKEIGNKTNKKFQNDIKKELNSDINLLDFKYDLESDKCQIIFCLSLD